MMPNKTDPFDFWNNNVVLVQLLSLSPLLAISQTTIKGVALALCTSVVAISAALVNRLLYKHIRTSLRFVWMLFLVGSFTTIIELLLQIFFYPLYRELGIYVPLISCNLALLIHLEQQYREGSNASYSLLLKRGLLMAAGLLLVMAAFSMLREILVFGSVLRDVKLLTSGGGIPIDTALNSRDNQLLSFGLLQPGAFILFALVLAFQRWLDIKLIKPNTRNSQPIEKVTRARVTGKL